MLPRSTHPYVVRLRPDGTLDPGFGIGGLVDTGIPTGATLADAHSLDTNAAGEVVYADLGTVLKLDPSGQPDTSFSGDGQLAAPPINDVALAADGSVLVTGLGGLIRFTLDGTRDFVFPSSSSAAFQGRSVAIAADGSVVVQGGMCSSFGTPYCTGLLDRLLPDGTKDAGFTVTSAIQKPGVPGLEVDAQGRVVELLPVPLDDGGLAIDRFSPTGALDGGFGRKGRSLTFPDGCGFIGADMAIDASGRIVASGSVCGHYGAVVVKDDQSPQNRDADGLLDRDDRCPIYPSNHPDGCGTVAARKIAIQRPRRHVLEGQLSLKPRIGGKGGGNCLVGRKVIIFRDGSKRIDSDRTSFRGDEDGVTGVWRIKSPAIAEGTYRAVIKPTYARIQGERTVRCKGVRSRRVGR